MFSFPMLAQHHIIWSKMGECVGWDLIDHRKVSQVHDLLVISKYKSPNIFVTLAKWSFV